MPVTSFYPLRFNPLFEYRLWGGRNLDNWLDYPLPGDGPIGEAWLLSDRDDHPSRVSNGPLKGLTIAQLLEHGPEHVLGALSLRHKRLPLLLKFLDVRAMLSVQVHPPDVETELIPIGETGKTEAWVVLEAGMGSRIYAGLKPGVTAAELCSLSDLTVDKRLASFRPVVGQTVLIEAGAVHSLGDGVVVFEIQQNSDVTYRLYDWDHIDPRTAQKRPLQVEQAIACVNFAQGAIGPIEPVREVGSTMRQQLVECSHFQVFRVNSEAEFQVGAEGEMRILVCLSGGGEIEFNGAPFGISRGEVMLLPAVVGACRFLPNQPVSLLEIAVPVAP